MCLREYIITKFERIDSLPIETMVRRKTRGGGRELVYKDHTKLLKEVLQESSSERHALRVTQHEIS